jgi:DNA-binding CsgD family transcriptional regulator/tetratricopeptide (TPR) repeat protein
MLRLSGELGDKGSIATALNSLGTVAAYQGDHERARALLEENLGILSQIEAEHPDTTLKRFHAFNLLGLLALDEENEPARAMELWEESLKLARKAGDPHRISMTLCNLGYAAVLQGDFQRGATFGEEALEFFHKQGNAGVDILPEILVNLGLAALGQGNLERAAASLDKAVAMSREAGRKPTTINALEGMASLAAASGDAPRAAHLWGAAEAERESTGIALPPGDRALHEPYLVSAHSRLGKDAWEEELDEGRAMSLEEAAEYALSKEERDLPTAPVPEEQPAREPIGKLTHREQEVAVLVAQGLTNRQISINLSISERTVENHVAKIFGKLGLRSRAQIATWVTEHHLITRPDPI